ncbi:hypothetical protein ACIRPQ_16030 [Streptomyces sp. NPDC101213]|uniref:hypothetical protein n=1 Tax=Streptomyces sp. NPDC101213 TaxID=3366130 RepID=UPI00382907C2
MADHRLEGPGENGTPVPRDLPDQQADGGEDRWDAAPVRSDENSGKSGEGDGADPGLDPDADVPDTDEAGTGRQGAPRPATVNPDHPTPDESSG